jgi:hypothetical protein
MKLSIMKADVVSVKTWWNNLLKNVNSIKVPFIDYFNKESALYRLYSPHKTFCTTSCQEQEFPSLHCSFVPETYNISQQPVASG